MINEAQHMLNRHLQKSIQSKETPWSELKNEITDVLGPYLYEKTKRRPMILPIIMEV
jgi:ribonuclease J